MNTAMSQDIVNALHEKDDNAKVFITVTGDRNLRPPILNALEKGISVELWSWEEALAREFRQLANTQPEFRAQTLAICSAILLTYQTMTRKTLTQRMP